jgi:hypothetical protein
MTRFLIQVPTFYAVLKSVMFLAQVIEIYEFNLLKSYIKMILMRFPLDKSQKSAKYL